MTNKDLFNPRSHLHLAVEEDGYLSGLFSHDPRRNCPVARGFLRSVWMQGWERGQDRRLTHKVDLLRSKHE